MPRVETWERLLAEAFEVARTKLFVWGQQDCTTFAFETRTLLPAGEDAAALWRGHYTKALGSQRVLRRLGWRLLHDMGLALLG